MVISIIQLNCTKVYEKYNYCSTFFNLIALKYMRSTIIVQLFFNFFSTFNFMYWYLFFN